MAIKKVVGFENTILLEKNYGHSGGKSFPYGINFYEVLGVNKNDSKVKIIKAFNKLALNHHPDKGGNREKWNIIEMAKNVLTDNLEKTEYDRFIKEDVNFLSKDNSAWFRNEIIHFTKKKMKLLKISTTTHLPLELHNWETDINNAAGFSRQEVNSYVALIINIAFNFEDLKKEFKISDKAVLKKIRERFAGLQSKAEVDKISENIREEMLDKGEGTNKEQKRNKGLKDLKNLPGYADLIDPKDQAVYEQKMKNATAESDYGISIKSLDQVITELLNKVKERIKFLKKEKENNEKLAPKKKHFIQQLHKLQGWNELLEPWEQEHLEEKINAINIDDESFFKSRLNYASYFIQGGHLRKYRAKFWDELEKLTDLKKIDIIREDGSADGADGKRRGEKIGEKYETLQDRKEYKKLEPQPIQRLDREKFEKMKLFLCYFKKISNFNWYLLQVKIKSYGEDVDSGWNPSSTKPKPNSSSLTPYAKITINSISSALERKRGETEEKILGINWKKRFENVNDDEEIEKLEDDFLERIKSYRQGKPNPWSETNNNGEGDKTKTPPPVDPLKNKKEQVIAEILEEAFNNEPAIDEEQLEKENQNWKNDINNASTESKINFIKQKILVWINHERTKKKEKNDLEGLINEARKDANWNSYQRLKIFLDKIKNFQASDSYKENKLEIYDIENRLKELNPENFKNSFKDDFDKKTKDYGLSPEEISDETQKLMEEAIETGDIDKKRKAEESIIQEGSDKELNEVITLVETVIKTDNPTAEQKEELIAKILEIISKNDYQKKSYQKAKNKVDKLLSILKGEEEHQDPEKEVSWSKTIAAVAVISLIVTILVFAVMKTRSHRKPRKT